MPDRGEAKVWDAHTGQELFTLQGHTGSVTSVAFSPDGTRLASTSTDQTVKVWNAQTVQESLTLKGNTAYVNSVAFSPDGKRLASTAAEEPVTSWTIKVWDVQTGQELRPLRGHSWPVTSTKWFFCHSRTLFAHDILSDLCFLQHFSATGMVEYWRKLLFYQMVLVGPLARMGNTWPVHLQTKQ